MKRHIYYLFIRLVLLAFAELLVMLFCAGLSIVFQIVISGLILLYWLAYMIYEIYYFHKEEEYIKRNLSFYTIILAFTILVIVSKNIFLN